MKPRQAARAAEGPFVVGRIAAVQQMHGGEGGFDEFTQSERRRHLVAAFHYPAIVILSRLRHNEDSRRQFFQAHVVGVTGKQAVPDAAEFPKFVAEYFAAGGGGEQMFRDTQPGGVAGGNTPAARILRVETAYPHHADSARALRCGVAGISEEQLRQLRV